eukprot:gene12014-5414_t
MNEQCDEESNLAKIHEFIEKVEIFTELSKLNYKTKEELLLSAKKIFYCYIDDESKGSLTFSPFCCFITYQKLICEEMNMFEMALNEIKGEIRKIKPKEKQKTKKGKSKQKKGYLKPQEVDERSASLVDIEKPRRKLTVEEIAHKSLMLDTWKFDERFSVDLNSIDELTSHGSFRDSLGVGIVTSLSRNSSINLKFGEEKTKPNHEILLEIVKKGEIDSLKQNIEEMNFDVKKKCGKTTLLHCATYYKQLKIVEFLIGSGLNVDLVDSTQRTPLHIAANYGLRDIAIYYLSLGSNVNSRDNYGYTPLFLALNKHHFELADDLILFNAEINLKRGNGMGILHETATKGDIEIIQWLIDQKGVKYNIKDTNGETPLMKSCVSSPPDFIYNFTNIKEVDILSSDESGRNMLHFAVLNQRIDFLSLLGSKFSDMEEEDERKIPFKTMLTQVDHISKQTPLHLAVSIEKLALVLCLTSLMTLLNCPFNKKDKKHMTAFDLAKEKFNLNSKQKDVKNEQIVQIYEYLSTISALTIASTGAGLIYYNYQQSKLDDEIFKTDIVPHLILAGKYNSIFYFSVGKPGAGKGTMSSMIKSKYNTENISIGDLIRAEVTSKTELGNNISIFLESQQKIPDDFVFELFMKKFKSIPKGKGWILDGFPRTKIEVDFLNENNIKVDHVIFLEISDDLSIKRQSGRVTDVNTGKTYHMIYDEPPLGAILTRRDSDKSPEKIFKRVERYHQQMTDFETWFPNTYHIDASKEKEKVFEDIIQILKKK